MDKEPNRIASLSIMVKDRTSSQQVNDILGRHGEYIIGRLGIPYHDKHVSIIVVVVDADAGVIGSLGGSLGNVPGVTLRSVTLA